MKKHLLSFKCASSSKLWAQSQCNLQNISLPLLINLQVLQKKKENQQNYVSNSTIESKINQMKGTEKINGTLKKILNQGSEGKFSFGQSSGLQDDLDVDEVDYGKIV